MSAGPASPPVNLGCGSRFHASWLNLDLGSSSPQVKAWDLRERLPVPDGSTPFVYSSHLLEHLRRGDAERLIADILRVLAPGGVIRVVVPDLAKLARWYLAALERGDGAEAEVEWARIHLIDQLTRESSGGLMRSFLLQAGPEAARHAEGRMGSEARSCFPPVQPAAGASAPSSLARRLAAPNLLGRVFARGRRAVAQKLVAALLGRRGAEALEAGWFATSGELHRWMYDERNLSALLRRAGFVGIRRQTAAESLWPGWAAENLDLDPDGLVYKPDSLFLEGQRPG